MQKINLCMDHIENTTTNSFGDQKCNKLDPKISHFPLVNGFCLFSRNTKTTFEKRH